MNFQRAALIYNPTSGRNRDEREKTVLQARDAMGPHVAEVQLARTAAQGDATRLAAQAVEDGCDLITVCGGDGTINEAIRGMVGSDVPLFTLPAGTANVLAEEVGMPTNPLKAAALLPSLVPARVSLGRVRRDGDGETRVFLLMCGVGVDANIVYNLDTKLKEYLGVGAYWLGSLEQMQKRRFQHFDIKIEGQSYDCTFALISKSRRYAGKLVVTPDANLLADRFQIVLFHGDTPLRYVGYLAQAATQTLDQFEDVSFHYADRVELPALAEGEVHIEVDGEYAGQLPAAVEIVPDALTVMLPEKYIERCQQSPASEEVSSATQS